MNNITTIVTILNRYAEIADSIGDYENADKCLELLKEAENFNNSNIRTAMERTAFLKKVFRGIKNIGKGIDKFVRKNLGGWTTIAAIAAAPYLAKLAPKLKGIGSQVVNAIKSGKNPMDLLQSKNPLVAQIAGDFINNMQSQMAGGQAQGTGQQQGQISQQPTAFTFGQGFDMRGFGQQQPQSAVQFNDPQSVLVNFKNNAISKINTAKNQTEAQAIFNQIKRSDIETLKQQLRSVTNNQQPEDFNKIPAYLELIKTMAKSNRGYNLQ